MVTFRGAFSLLRDAEGSPPMEGKRVEAAAADVCVRRCGLLSVDDDDGGLGLGGVPRGRPADRRPRRVRRVGRGPPPPPRCRRVGSRLCSAAIAARRRRYRIYGPRRRRPSLW